MPYGGRRAFGVVDADQWHIGQGRLIEDYDGVPAGSDGVHGRMAVGQRLDHPGVDRGIANRIEIELAVDTGVQQ